MTARRTRACLLIAGGCAVALLLGGCDEREESGSTPLGMDGKQDEASTEKQLETVRKHIQEQIEKAKKKKLETAKKGGVKSGEFDPKNPQAPLVSTPADSRMLTFGFDPKKREEQKKEGVGYSIGESKRDGTSQSLYWSGTEKGKPVAAKDGTLSFVPEGNAGNSIVAPGMAGATGSEASKKPGLWERLFGKKKESGPNDPLKFGGVGPAHTMVAPRNSVPEEPGAKDSLLRRIDAEIARKRLGDEVQGQEDAAAGKEEPKATIVDPEKSAARPSQSGTEAQRRPEVSPVTPFDAAASPGSTLPPQSLARTPPNAEEFRAAIEQVFLQGLTSKDLQARTWSFRFAGEYRRSEALPILIQEIREQGTLAPLAARCLGPLGEKHREVSGILLEGLASKDHQMRQASADALGRMRAPAGARAISKLLKAEKNYTVRSTFCQALGHCGDEAGIPALKALLAVPGEVEAVKAQAALALAQLGDRSGKHYLVSALSRPDSVLQMLGLAGLAQLGDPDIGGYLSTALESEHEEVWVSAVHYFPQWGPAQALPLLKERMLSPHPILRRRAALALGMLGSDDGMAFLVQALQEGEAAERMLAADLLGRLKRRDKIPLLVEKLRDSQASVRQVAALALARLNAKEALPALMDAARGAKAVQELPAALRRSMPDVSELMVLMRCIRSLNGEQGEMAFSTRPSSQDLHWPEYDRELFKRQLDLLKTYQLLAVLSAEGQPVGAVLKEPGGREVLYRKNEHVAAGFQVWDLFPGQQEGGKFKHPPCVTLIRGETRVTLAVGREPEVLVGRQEKKEAGEK